MNNFFREPVEDHDNVFAEGNNHDDDERFSFENGLVEVDEIVTRYFS